MAVLVYSDLQNEFLDALVANTATDAPFSSAEIARALNDAYADLYELEGRGRTLVASATAWTNAQTATGVVTGILTNIRKPLTVWASTTAASTGLSDDDTVLEIFPFSRIQWRRSGGRVVSGSTERPRECSITPIPTTTPASVGLHRLDYWPMGTGYYFPFEYIKQFTPIDSATVTTPDLSDLGSRLLPLLAARRKANTIRPDLGAGIDRAMRERITADRLHVYAPILAGAR